jgi:hypothetical protein
MAGMFLRILREVITTAFDFARVLTIPLVLVGVAFLSGVIRLDISRRDDIKFGLQFLGTAAAVWGAGFLWFAFCHREDISWRFSLRTLLIATTLVAVAVGLIVYVAR